MLFFTCQSHSADRQEAGKKNTAIAKEFKKNFSYQNGSYTFSLEEFFIKNKDQETEGSVFLFYYQAQHKNKMKQRPISFVFNGGPGSSSVWLHLGLLGPKIIPFQAGPVHMGLQEQRLIDNKSSLLSDSDLVFIDPVATGYSRITAQSPKREFMGTEADKDYLSELIIDFLNKHQRWTSPKFLIGESYGALRATLILDQLQHHFFNSIPFHGLVLISPALDIQLLDTQYNNPTAFSAFLPTYAATHQYYQNAESASLNQARTFSIGPYLAWQLHEEHSQQNSNQIHQTLKDLTGFSKKSLKRAFYRLSPSEFRSHYAFQQLKAHENAILGRMDSRYLSSKHSGRLNSGITDPSISAINHQFNLNIHQYLSQTLAPSIQQNYLVGTSLAKRWQWQRESKSSSSQLSATEELARALHENPKLKVLATTGLYDLATPFFATEISLSRPGIPKDRVELKQYEAGHMMYTEPDLRQRLLKDIQRFYQEQLS